MQLIRILSQGIRYSRTWPTKPELNAIFPENKVIFLTRKGVHFLPVLSVITALVQFKLLGAEHLGQIIAMMLFLAALPLQGFYWLGIRADNSLPPALINWGSEIREQIIKHGQLQSQPGSLKSYFDLAKLLQQAYQQLDNTVMRRWF
ncbi:terminus macrodomain insulation protein YfbV [Alishewanella sp. SMS8]|uniref:terminus macrodomain insulation protein YfbV n=1 Tax=Alishewanella sp. SMS8 TaxID=2994676 RepID=UPI002741ABAC|nr:terminus macrodomain insulation protein YfbV [Alishewanella sp. SMS8]MDP5457803.1 terminus macrodomain insulation protein YfbV [Alishewanella sp. SMS8]